MSSINCNSLSSLVFPPCLADRRLPNNGPLFPPSLPPVNRADLTPRGVTEIFWLVSWKKMRLTGRGQLISVGPERGIHAAYYPRIDGVGLFFFSPLSPSPPLVGFFRNSRSIWTEHGAFIVFTHEAVAWTDRSIDIPAFNFSFTIRGNVSFVDESFAEN